MKNIPPGVFIECQKVNYCIHSPKAATKNFDLSGIRFRALQYRGMPHEEASDSVYLCVLERYEDVNLLSAAKD